MTPDDYIDLARQLVASPAWRWMPGMHAIIPGSHRARGVVTWVGTRTLEVARAHRLERLEFSEVLPAIGSPSTCGCMSAILGTELGAVIGVGSPELLARTIIEQGGLQGANDG